MPDDLPPGYKSAWPADALERRPIAALIPHARNSRTHSEAQVLEVAASIREWGWTMPVLVDDAGTILAGHARVLAAQLLEITEVPVVVARGWSEAKKRAYIIADNKLTLNAGWDEEILRSELAGLREEGFDVGLTGFSDDEIAALGGYSDVPDESGGGGDVAPLIPLNPITRRGDVWLCGMHRIMCGDCRSDADVATLMAGATINLAFTSPPYAEQRTYDAGSEFAPIPPAEYVAWFAPVARNVQLHLAPDGSWFVNIKPSADGLDTELYVFDLVLAHAREWGWHYATEFVWERNGVPKSVTRRFKNQFEPIYQFAMGEWKMRPDAVRHYSDNVPVAGGPGVGDTSWANAQGGNGAMFGAQKRKRKDGYTGPMANVQGGKGDPGEYLAPGMAYPGNRLPAFEGAQKRRTNLVDKEGKHRGMGDDWQGTSSENYGETYIGPGLAYPGNRLPTFAGSHEALGHTAAFPVGLPEWFLRAYTDAGDAVYDPFMGSGSTLIAAERQQRRAFGMEISPAYVDVIVQRWMRESGEVAVRESDGFDMPPGEVDDDEAEEGEA